eukprot:322350-Prorocentrum_minimum.AAC.3
MVRSGSCAVTTLDQSEAGSEGIFSRRTNQRQEARVYSHDGPIGLTRKKTLTTNPLVLTFGKTGSRSARKLASPAFGAPVGGR